MRGLVEVLTRLSTKTVYIASSLRFYFNRALQLTSTLKFCRSTPMTYGNKLESTSIEIFCMVLVVKNPTGWNFYCTPLKQRLYKLMCSGCLAHCFQVKAFVQWSQPCPSFSLKGPQTVCLLSICFYKLEEIFTNDRRSLVVKRFRILHIEYMNIMHWLIENQHDPQWLKGITQRRKRSTTTPSFLKMVLMTRGH